MEAEDQPRRYRCRNGQRRAHRTAACLSAVVGETHADTHLAAELGSDPGSRCFLSRRERYGDRRCPETDPEQLVGVESKFGFDLALHRLELGLAIGTWRHFRLTWSRRRICDPAV